jgi:hypothetical protein
VCLIIPLCNAIDQPAITTILNKIRDSDYIMNDLEDCLKPYAGKELRLITNDPRIGLIIIDEVCQAILEYYVFDARIYKGKEVNTHYFEKRFGVTGISTSLGYAENWFGRLPKRGVKQFIINLAILNISLTKVLNKKV